VTYNFKEHTNRSHPISCTSTATATATNTNTNTNTNTGTETDIQTHRCRYRYRYRQRHRHRHRHKHKHKHRHRCRCRHRYRHRHRHRHNFSLYFSLLFVVPLTSLRCVSLPLTLSRLFLRVQARTRNLPLFVSLRFFLPFRSRSLSL